MQDVLGKLSIVRRRRPDGTYLGVQERGGILALGAARGEPWSETFAFAQITSPQVKPAILAWATLLGRVADAKRRPTTSLDTDAASNAFITTWQGRASRS